MNRSHLKVVVGALALISAAYAQAQHLRWLPRPIPENYTCIYGEIEVLASGPGAYFCGCNWWPEAEASGYAGIQEGVDNRRDMIFSVWDSKSGVMSRPFDVAPGTTASRFTDAGEGTRTVRNYNWPTGKIYRYFCVKRQMPKEDVTLTSAYYYDDTRQHWVYSATIASPNLPGHGGIGGFGGSLSAFIQNLDSKYKDRPKIALYRLWMGTSPAELSEVASASGDGVWGVLNGSFYLAQGDAFVTVPMISGFQVGEGVPEAGANAAMKITPRKLPPDLLRQLELLAKG